MARAVSLFAHVAHGEMLVDKVEFRIFKGHLAHICFLEVERKVVFSGKGFGFSQLLVGDVDSPAIKSFLGEDRQGRQQATRAAVQNFPGGCVAGEDKTQKAINGCGIGAQDDVWHGPPFGPELKKFRCFNFIRWMSAGISIQTEALRAVSLRYHISSEYLAFLELNYQETGIE